MDFSVEMTNEDTGEIKTVSFESEEERQTFVEKLPEYITWFVFENGQLFSKKVDWGLALR